MLRKYFLLFLCVFPLMVFSQVNSKARPKGRPTASNAAGKSSSDDGGKEAKTAADTIATIDMYKIITFDRDTTYVDTALTLKKEYEVNYLRKDNFGLLALSNDGQAYNKLDFGLTKFNPFPEMGFTAKHSAYMEVEDINYYNVATPYTDLMYRSVTEQGQMLDAFITFNTSENLNFAVGYKGLRSLGRYINQLSSNGNFRFITSYNTTDRRYMLRAHFTGQDFTNQENGGITRTNIPFFESGQAPYTQRERLDVYLKDAQSVLKGNRYFIDHTFRLNKDNPNSLVFHHQFNFENKFFEYTSTTPNIRYGEAYTASVNNKTRYNRMYNKVGAAYFNETIGTVEFYLEDFKYNYFYRTIILNSSGEIGTPNSISDRIDTYGAKYSYQKNKWKGSVLFSNSITSQSLANIDASARYAFDEKNVVSGRYQNMNKLPNHNFNLYQSDYKEYNWPTGTGTADFKTGFNNEKINNFEFEAKTQWLTASLQYTVLNDYLYFYRTNTDTAVRDTEINSVYVKPAQDGNTINYLSLKVSREFKFGKFALDNTFLYQNVQQTGHILNVPNFVTRNTIYYSDRVFKKALMFQTGITFQYFTKYYANEYNPVIGEFYIQQDKKIGNYPVIDFFLNAKIQEFRLFLKAEHFNSSFTGYNYYTTPTQPYKDFIIRFGIIWDFFS
ncbi:putative porin [Flavobacterium sp. DG1-102-2]|uniref:putative porin n=1 Tax=Flavobacterium sp. DG1-102-2 TaxID=3081663 RepID=UPI002949ACA1|nr:putative porin [Flavobacterium sp. DG1-102-2]MDV6170160.1 putative porin [Flavobacterium sp. DG1-102-2]